jgi:hypothetical protein
MGCNIGGGEAPACYDNADLLFVFWACMGETDCPFQLSDVNTASLIFNGGEVKPQSPFPQKQITHLEIDINKPADSCSSATTCEECTADSGCAWCIGTLFDSSASSQTSGASCFSSTDSDYQCQGTTLTTTCTVYKCPWYEYYLQDPSTEGDCSGLTCTETTGDDPDFVRTNTPAMAYSSMDSCTSNCVDPTTGCSDDDTCSRTYTCNASSTCNACSDNADIPTHYKV